MTTKSNAENLTFTSMERFTGSIKEHKYYQVLMAGAKPVIVFDDHRFVIPVLWLARQCGIIGLNINMVRYDGHLDNLDYDQGLSPVFTALKSFDEAFDFADRQMKKEDDD